MPEAGHAGQLRAGCTSPPSLETLPPKPCTLKPFALKPPILRAFGCCRARQRFTTLPCCPDPQTLDPETLHPETTTLRAVGCWRARWGLCTLSLEAAQKGNPEPMTRNPQPETFCSGVPRS